MAKLEPGIIGTIVSLHGKIYYPDGYDLGFEVYVAETLTDLHPVNDGI